MKKRALMCLVLLAGCTPEGSNALPNGDTAPAPSADLTPAPVADMGTTPSADLASPVSPDLAQNPDLASAPLADLASPPDQTQPAADMTLPPPQCGKLVACGQDCVDTGHDPKNCGGCGLACSGQNIVQNTPSCNDGVCGGQCQLNFGDCDSDKLTNGCETNLLTSNDNCGACGHLCVATANMVSLCNGGLCDSTCVKGFQDCNWSLADGCEVNLTNDPANCGACWNRCGLGQTCVNAQCVAQPCAQGQTSCNGSCVNLLTDPANCGKCGNACGNGATCVNGACQVQMQGCQSPVNITFPQGNSITMLIAWDQNGKQLETRIFNQPVVGKVADVPAGTCAITLQWSGFWVDWQAGIQQFLANAPAATADLPSAGLVGVKAYALDTGPAAYGWAHDGTHRR